jgi:hypothetical protein
MRDDYVTAALLVIDDPKIIERKISYELATPAEIAAARR